MCDICTRGFATSTSELLPVFDLLFSWSIHIWLKLYSWVEVLMG